MPPIKQRLAALKKALGVAGARDAQVTPFPALPEKAIAALERKHGVRLPDALRGYYSEVNGHHIAWSLPHTGVMGRSTVSPLASFLSRRVTGYVDGVSRTDAPFYSKYLDPARP